MTASGRILIVSPIPSEPRNQGNSARIAAMGEVLQAEGWIVHFLYHKLEGITPPQEAAMALCWDHLHMMEGPPRPPKRSDSPLDLDDWYDPALSDFAAALHRKWRFAAVVANYVWCSAVLEVFGPGVLRVLDTHDVFGGRDERFRELGLPPAWYYTTPAEEAAGLRRADIVLAIQDEEAKTFRQLGHPDVRTLGHLLPLRRRAPSPGAVGRPTAGYLGSGNPLNVSAFMQLRDTLAEGPAKDRPGRLVLAGTICAKVADPAPFTMMGEVEDADAFYDAVDLVLNPMPGGTGLKIKSVEAVHRGMPLIATVAAMAGLPAEHPAHRLASVAELVQYLLRTRWSRAALANLRLASERCAAEYAAGVRAAYRTWLDDLASAGTRRAGRS